MPQPAALRRRLLLLAACMPLAMGVSACGNAPCTPNNPLTHPAPNGCLRFGVSTPGGAGAVAEFRQVASRVGRPPSIVLSYSDFTSAPPVDGLKAVTRLGADPMVTWEPWKWLKDGEYDTTTFSMRSIADGAHDDYLYWWADALVRFRHTIYLRFAHEPNGTWYPWSATGGTDPSTYVRAWRHVHDIFVEKHAGNVKWVWAPNISFPGSTSIVDTYPGARYVDVVGIDGYNWGTTRPTTHWIAPADLFGPTIAEVRAIAPGKPLVVTEVGSAEQGGDKARWVRELIGYFNDTHAIAGFIWFDHDKETDWRLASTPESAAAFAEELGKRYR
jgi:mannan endo-1,4-beta-mannosidase